MTNTSNKVTVMFESQVNNPQEDSPVLLSGPIEVFATTETFNDLGTKETRDAILDSYSLDDEDNIPSITIFVDDVSNLGLNNPNHRGAYFRYSGTIENLNDDSLWSDDNTNTSSACHLWKEILLGTHSHSNPELLEKLSSVFSINSNGEIELNNDFINNLHNNNSLPALPENIQNKIDELKKYSDLSEPTESCWNHLDAPLDELRDTYDWLLHDEEGHFRNLAVGNCREIYRALKKSDNKLYLSLSDHENILSTIKSDKCTWLQLEAAKVNYNIGAETDPTTLVALEDPASSEKILFKVELPFNVTDNDHLFLFNGNKIILNGFSEYGDLEDITAKDTHGYTITKTLNNVIHIEFFKSDFQYTDDQVLTIIMTCDVPSDDNFDSEFIKTFVLEKTTLQNINAELLKLYTEGELNRRPYVPHLYLTTDEYGTIHWDNKLLPSQTFEHKTLAITEEYLAQNTIDSKTKIIFDLSYEVDEDFPLLLVNGFFEFTAIPTIDDKSGKMLYEFDSDALSTGDILNLILIKKSSAGSIADEIAENYVSKEDAVNILSHGKINLSDYASLDKLSEYTKIGHTHSQYALKEHNHDYRYANYKHTHPELVSLLIELSKKDVSEDEVNSWLNKISEQTENQLKAIIDSLGYTETDSGTYKILDEKITLSDDVVSNINTALENANSEAHLNSGDSVKDALSVLVQLFNDDTAYDDQVILKNDLNVTNKIGGTESYYKAGTTISTIISDMLNPKVDLTEMINILTPVKAELKFYAFEDESSPVDFSHIKNNGSLYYTVRLLNKYGNECSANLIVNGYSYTQHAEIISVNDSSQSDAGFYHLKDLSDLVQDDNTLSIELSIKYNIVNDILDKSYSNSNIIYDTYCVSSKKVEESELIHTENGYMDYPDYYWLYSEKSNNEYSVISVNADDFISGYNGEDNSINKTVKSGGTLYILLEDNYSGKLKVIDNTSSINILKFMEKDNSTIIDGYTTYRYDFANSAEIDLTVSATN